MNKVKNTIWISMVTLTILAIAAIVLILWPFLIVASLNTLFGLGIEHSVWTYLSVLFLNLWMNLKVQKEF